MHDHPAEDRRAGIALALLVACTVLTLPVAAPAADLISAKADMARRTALIGQRAAWAKRLPTAARCRIRWR